VFDEHNVSQSVKVEVGFKDKFPSIRVDIVEISSSEFQPPHWMAKEYVTLSLSFKDGRKLVAIVKKSIEPLIIKGPMQLWLNIHRGDSPVSIIVADCLH